MFKAKRLSLFTGKGGVGKSSCSLAYAKMLQEKKLTVHYVTFSPGFTQKIDLCEKLDIIYEDLQFQNALKEYLIQKTGTEFFSSILMESSFFKALLNIQPSFEYLVLISKLVNEILKNENEFFILDSPSTGHALSMIESIFNYEKIFTIGPLKKDILKVKNFLTNPDLIDYFIVANPEEMSLEESHGLSESFLKIDPTINCKIILNKILDKNLEVIQTTTYWKNLFELQKENLTNWVKKMNFYQELPYVPSKNNLDLILQLANAYKVNP